MARKPTGPRYYPSRKAYYVTICGVTHCLHKADADTPEAKMEALRRYDKLLSALKGAAAGDDEPISNLVEKFLNHARTNAKPATYRSYQHVLTAFASIEGARRASEIRPHHVTEVINRMRVPRGPRGLTWGNGTARMLISTLKAACEWGVKQGYLSANPLVTLPRGVVTARTEDCLVTEEQHRLMVSQAYPELVDLLEMLWHTGSRPLALCLLEARDIQGTRAVMQGRPGLKLKRIVLYFNKEAMAIVQRLAEKYPEGPILRASTGLPWAVGAVATSIRRLRERCGCSHVTAYSYRHAYAHRGLRRGVPIAVLAKLMNTSVGHIERTYGHLHTATDVLQAVAESI